MGSIGVLEGICKKKRVDCDYHSPCPKLFTGVLILALSTVFCLPLPGLARGADTTLSTRNTQSVNDRDPASNDRIMRTPDSRPQHPLQGPQTIIVSPEIHLGGSPGGGPGHTLPDTPRPPQRQ